MAAVGAALGVGIGGPIVLWLLSIGGWAGEGTINWYKGIGSAVAAVIGEDADMWLDATGRAVGAVLGSGVVAYWIGCPSHQITGAATGALVGYWMWVLVFVGAGLFPNSHEALKWLLMETTQTEWAWAMFGVTMSGATIGMAVASRRAGRKQPME